jgi:hypothetical protein
MQQVLITLQLQQGRALNLQGRALNLLMQIISITTNEGGKGLDTEIVMTECIIIVTAG